MWRSAHEKLVLSLALTLSCILVACQAGPPEGTEPAPIVPVWESAPGFSGVLACTLVQDLVDLESRRRGARAKTRRFLRQELERIGAEIREVRVPAALPGSASSSAANEVPEDVHLVGLLPGASGDRFILAAAYGAPRFDARGVRENDASASAVALVLELARLIAQKPRPYSSMILLIDAMGETASEAGDAAKGGDPSSASSRRLARFFSEEELFERVRVAAFFQRVGEDDVSIARDLYSHAVYRDVFFDAARDLGHGATFPADATFTSPEGSHRAFVDAGLLRVVAIDGGPAYGTVAASPDDRAPLSETCSTRSMEIVGDVSLEALDRIGARLERIDRFHASPLSVDLDAPRRMAPSATLPVSPPVSPPADPSAGQAVAEPASPPSASPRSPAR